MKLFDTEFMRRTSDILCLSLFFAFTLGPLALIIVASFVSRTNTSTGIVGGGLTLEWYSRALRDVNMRNAVVESAWIGLAVGLVTMAVGFLGSLTWFSPRLRNILLIVEFGCALLPAESHALGLSDVLDLLFLPRSGRLPIVLAHVVWALPFATVIDMIGMSYVNPTVVEAGLELSSRFRVLVRLVIPLVGPSIISSFLVGFLLSFNESSRAYLLSSAYHTIGEYARDKMRSGMDPSAQAMASVDVVFGALALAAVLTGVYLTRRMSQRVLVTRALEEGVLSLLQPPRSVPAPDTFDRE